MTNTRATSGLKHKRISSCSGELFKSVCHANNLNSIKVPIDKLAYALSCSVYLPIMFKSSKTLATSPHLSTLWEEVNCGKKEELRRFELHSLLFTSMLKFACRKKCGRKFQLLSRTNRKNLKADKCLHNIPWNWSRKGESFKFARVSYAWLHIYLVTKPLIFSFCSWRFIVLCLRVIVSQQINIILGDSVSILASEGRCCAELSAQDRNPSIVSISMYLKHLEVCLFKILQ